MKGMMTYMHIMKDGRTIYTYVDKTYSKELNKMYKIKYKIEMLGKKTMVVYH